MTSFFKGNNPQSSPCETRRPPDTDSLHSNDPLLYNPNTTAFSLFMAVGLPQQHLDGPNDIDAPESILRISSKMKLTNWLCFVSSVHLMDGIVDKLNASRVVDRSNSTADTVAIPRNLLKRVQHELTTTALKSVVRDLTSGRSTTL
ncbi:uncharacterized protein PpBr36_09607 [Pyricularia pennisetigena]|uniref:uncharacterized protein n=1 Tax=Pyricularia pennisetigena TaxID=1578925 RepID=UPI00114E1A19|nr:uncharacterized protein PpBr36_09607 [Pyricularia pennisetigena]TLS21609.1 hypothetical protein PpBr36_09607 [Pyricularia pennisetigena]